MSTKSDEVTKLSTKLSARLTLENKYLDACYAGDTKTVEYMIKKEGKTLKNDYFLVRCLQRVCESESEGSVSDSNIFEIIHSYRNIYDIDRHYIVLDKACQMGKLNIFKFYFRTSVIHHDLMLHCLYESCSSPNIQLIDFILNRVVTSHVDWNECLNCACCSGNLNSVNFILRHKAVWTVGSWNLSKACEGGNIEIVKLIFNMGSFAGLTGHLNENLLYACRAGKAGKAGKTGKAGETGGCIEVVNFLLEKGAKNSDLSVYGVCQTGNLEIVKLMLDVEHDSEHSLNFDWDMGINVACCNGHIDIVELLVDKLRFPNLDRYARTACATFNMDIVELLIKKGATNINEYLYHACLRGCYGLVELLVEKGADDWNKGLNGAYCGRHIDLFQLMIKYGATTFYAYAYNNHYTDITKLLISMGSNELKWLNDTQDYKLYVLYCKYKGIGTDNTKSRSLLTDYPPYVLFVGSRLSKNHNCMMRRLPIELFTIMHSF